MKQHFCPVEQSMVAFEKECNWCGETEEHMSKAQQVFEAMMRAKGYTDFTATKGRYSVPALQTRWNYFLLGWEMRGVQ